MNLGQWRFTRFALHPGGSAYADTKLLDWDRDIVAVFANRGTGEFASSTLS